MNVTQHPGRFNVGDWVSFLFGANRVWAQIIEDRGPLGVNRRRLYRLRLDRESSEPDEFELPEDDLKPAIPDKAAVVDYLKRGGLVSILGGTGNGTGTPRPVWLTFNAQGEVIHTFSADRGLIGGKRPPASAVLDGRIIADKSDGVMKFVAGFGLTKDEARSLVDAIGTRE